MNYRVVLRTGSDVAMLVVMGILVSGSRQAVGCHSVAFHYSSGESGDGCRELGRCLLISVSIGLELYVDIDLE